MLMMLFLLIFILRWISSENNLIDHFLVFPVGSKLRLEKFFSFLCLSRFVSNQDIRTEINKRSLSLFALPFNSRRLLLYFRRVHSF